MNQQVKKFIRLGLSINPTNASQVIQLIALSLKICFFMALLIFRLWNFMPTQVAFVTHKGCRLIACKLLQTQ